MGSENKYLRAGILVICGALVLRLVSSGAVASFVTKPEVITTLLFLETGRYVQPITEAPPETTSLPTEPSPSTEPPAQPPLIQKPAEAAAFSSGDAKLVTVNNVCGYDVDLQAMLEKSLTWDLTEDGPAVLIVHTHGTESYEKTEDYKESSAYRTLDNDYNMISVGDRLAQMLEAGGVQVLHDRTPHDSPSYNGAYSSSRKSVKDYLAQYPSIRMVLDIHRDSVTRSDGTQASYSLTVDGKQTAKLMMVVGTDASGNYHPNWKNNMALAVKLHAQLEKLAPGSCRTISFRKQRFNQDLSAGAMLIEVGAAGNTHDQALAGADLLAKGILALAKGVQPTLY